MNDLYQIVYVDQASDLYSFGVATEEDKPLPLFRSVADAKRGMEGHVRSFASFTAVAYGQAYPYEATTFEKELAQKGHAIYGWATLPEEQGGERFAVALLKLRLG
jgi:hypothetical protein